MVAVCDLCDGRGVLVASGIEWRCDACLGTGSEPDRISELVEAVGRLTQPVVNVPAPVVHVEPPNLTELSTTLASAVANLQPGLDPDTIIEGLKKHLQPHSESHFDSEVLEELTKTLKKLEFRIQGLGTQAYGGGSVRLEPGQTVVATGGLTNSELRGSPVPTTTGDYENRLDYDVRTDGNPVYVGKAAPGTATTASSWTIQKLTYDSSARLTRVQVLTGAWDSRTTLGW